VGDIRGSVAFDGSVEAVCCMYGISLEQLTLSGKSRPFGQARAVVAVLAHESRHLRLTDLALLFNREVSALSKAAQRLLLDKKLRGDLEKARNALEQITKCPDMRCPKRSTV
jgi:chromosomal replication initiation ATPase DnaA